MSSVHDVMMYKHDCPCDNPLHHRLSHLHNLHISSMFATHRKCAWCVQFNFLEDGQWRMTSFQVRTNYVRHVQDWSRKIFAWHMRALRAAANPPPLPARWNIELHKLQYHKLISGNLDTWTIFKFLLQHQLWLPPIKMSGYKHSIILQGAAAALRGLTLEFVVKVDMPRPGIWAFATLSSEVQPSRAVNEPLRSFSDRQA